MASYFYLYLYTEGERVKMNTNEVVVTLQKTKVIEKKGKEEMSITNKDKYAITIDEGTSHYIDVTVKDEAGNIIDLTDCSAVFSSCGNDKTCLIDEDNHIKVKLEPHETIGYLSAGYQIRLFDENDDVFQIIQGIIYINKAHKAYIEDPTAEQTE